MLLSELLEVDLVDIIPLDLLLQRSIHLFYNHSVYSCSMNYSTVYVYSTVPIPRMKRSLDHKLSYEMSFKMTVSFDDVETDNLSSSLPVSYCIIIIIIQRKLVAALVKFSLNSAKTSIV
jgi:hypothetical protein